MNYKKNPLTYVDAEISLVKSFQKPFRPATRIWHLPMIPNSVPEKQGDTNCATRYLDHRI